MRDDVREALHLVDHSICVRHCRLVFQSRQPLASHHSVSRSPPGRGLAREGEGGGRVIEGTSGLYWAGKRYVRVWEQSTLPGRGATAGVLVRVSLDLWAAGGLGSEKSVRAKV